MSAEVVSLSSAELSAEIIPFGASLVSLLAPDHSGAPSNVVPRVLRPHMGAIVGRYANRIGGASFELDGVRHRLAANEGINLLHGGDGGLGRRRWEIDAVADDAVSLRIESPAGDQGFPGTLSITVRYVLVGPSLEISIDAVTDAPTVVSFTNHTYWNLSASAATRIDDHLLTVYADRRVEVDGQLIPTGRLIELSDRDISLRSVIDDCYVIERNAPLAAVLTDPGSGRTMSVATNQPGLQIYTGDHLGVCLEAQQLPDAPNHREFPSTVLRPGEVHRHRTIHTFGTVAPTLAD